MIDSLADFPYVIIDEDFGMLLRDIVHGLYNDEQNPDTSITSYKLHYLWSDDEIWLDSFPVIDEKTYTEQCKPFHCLNYLKNSSFMIQLSLRTVFWFSCTDPLDAHRSGESANDTKCSACT